MTERLEESGAEAVASLWLYDNEAHKYYLNIASDFYDEHGPFKFYKKLLEALSEINEKTIGLSDIKAIAKSSHIVKALLSYLGNGHDILVNPSQYNGIYIIKLGFPLE